MKAFTIITLTLLLSLFISVLFVENTYGNGEHMVILSLCLTCAVFAAFGIIGSEVHDRFPMDFTQVVSYLVVALCLTGFVAGFVIGVPMLTIISTVIVLVLSCVKNLRSELKTA